MRELEDLSTTALLDQANSGDPAALETLYVRYVSRLKRWARVRVTSPSEPLVDTDEIVQRTLLRTLQDASASAPAAPRRFLGDVRRAIDANILRELERRKDVAPASAPVDDAYESAFRRLSDLDQFAIAARLEEGLDYREIARELGRKSPEEAETVVTEAILRLAQEMRSSTRR